MRLRGFVPLDELTPPASSQPAPTLPPAILSDGSGAWETRTSLFGDPDS